MNNFAEKPEEFGSKYNSIFEASLQQPIPAAEKEQYLKSMFNDTLKSLLTDEDRQEARMEGREQGIAEGRAEGRAEAKAEVAAAMKARGMSISDIADITGLSAEQIAEL